MYKRHSAGEWEAGLGFISRQSWSCSAPVPTPALAHPLLPLSLTQAMVNPKAQGGWEGGIKAKKMGMSPGVGMPRESGPMHLLLCQTSW